MRANLKVYVLNSSSPLSHPNSCSPQPRNQCLIFDSLPQHSRSQRIVSAQLRAPANTLILDMRNLRQSKMLILNSIQVWCLVISHKALQTHQVSPTEFQPTFIHNYEHFSASLSRNLVKPTRYRYMNVTESAWDTAREPERPQETDTLGYIRSATMA